MGLDLSMIYAGYERRDGRGKAAYHPLMMVRILLYGYCLGIMSSRRMERATYEDLAFRYLSAGQHPDHDTIAGFRRQHLPALAQLFTQVLQLCDQAGLVKLGHVAIDGTKLKANASKHKAMSYERMEKKEKQLKAEVEKLLAEAAETDAANDGLCGKGKRGDALHAELTRRERRLQKIAEAKAALEQEARERAEVAKKAVEEKLQQRWKQEQKRGRKFGGRRPRVPDPDKARPEPTAQRNFTDPESRIMPDGANKGSFLQGYNAQAAVDGQNQIIVAAAITQDTNDKKQLLPMLEQVEQNLGRKPETVTADAGYFSQAALTDEKVKEVDLLVPPDQQKHAPAAVQNPRVDFPPVVGVKTFSETMRERLRSPEGNTIYKLRKQIVEPVFGQIKEARRIRAFLLRGLRKVHAEWQLICATHNLLKLFRAGLPAL